MKTLSIPVGPSLRLGPGPSLGCAALVACALHGPRAAHHGARDAPAQAPARPVVALDRSQSQNTVTSAWTAAFRLQNRAFPTITEPDMVVHAPEDFDPRRPFHLVVLLHAWGGHAGQWVVAGDASLGPDWRVRNGWGLGARHDLAESNSLLIAPQFNVPHAGNWSGRYTERGFFLRVLSELLEQTLASRLGGPHSLADIDGITLVASSAGGVTAANLLLHEDLRARVRNVLLFDAFYGGESAFARWLLEAEAHAPRRFVCIHGGSHHTQPHAMELARRISPALGARMVIEPRGAMEAEVRAHRAVFASVNCEHVCMTGAWLDKVLRGLDLPSRRLRPASDPRLPWRASPTPARALSLGDEVSGALAASDARYRDWAPYDEYTLELSAGQEVTVTVTGGRALGGFLCRSLDVEAELLDGATRLAFADDGAGMLNTLMTFRSPRAGRFTLRVAAHGPWEHFGSYTLRVRQGRS